ncbi:hypothetical protein [Marinicellulosiphila megalodicopiae]|uniref:hypothetical protein n=1 Tax=Marinicellulosiphila megalodicopiae TaxID=2724896 RepID=UPI003BB12458
MKKLLIATTLTLSCSTVFAGGTGSTDIALASYGGIGAVVSIGVPLDITFLSDNGLHTYGEIEAAIGIHESVNAGLELAGGILVNVADGLSIYGSLGPAIGIDAGFGLGVEIGFNIDINDTTIFIEGGSHPGSNYVAVGMSL